MGLRVAHLPMFLEMKTCVREHAQYGALPSIDATASPAQHMRKYVCVCGMQFHTLCSHHCPAISSVEYLLEIQQCNF